MKRLLEVRWHARGGQGGKTAAQLLATSALASGMYVQAFAEYGPERMGAPITAFTRLSSSPINLHCHITNPDIVVVLDETLLDKVDVMEGLKEEGIILVNTPDSPENIRAILKGTSEGKQAKKLYTLNANKIAQEEIGRPIPNMPMLGALIKITMDIGSWDPHFGVIKLEEVIKDIKKKFKDKFKKEVVEGNVRAIKRAYEEVKE